jgi:CubicO group peptidase (beta-lactamase class C family)
MTRLTRGGIVAVCLAAACAPPAASPRQVPFAPASAPGSAALKPPAPSVEKLAADSPRTTAGGNTFTAPAGFTLTASDSAILLDPPESDSHAAVVDTRGGSLEDAVANAWKALHPAFNRPVKERTALTARFGWDERRVVVYETPPNEAARVYAYALRHSDCWTVLAVEFSNATFAMRLSPIELIEQSLRPKGYVPESFAGKKARVLDADRLKKLSDFVEHAMRDLGVPGAALGFVDAGKVVLAQGFGVRELGKPDRVDGDTLFMIASNTKALTTMLEARAVDEGKFDWDTPVTQVYPGFKTGDEETTRRMLMRHMLCACTGIPRMAGEWYFEWNRMTPRVLFELVAAQKPTTRFGEVFQYSNLMAAMTGYVTAHTLYPEKELNAAYEQAMKTRIFGPLGMKTATFEIDVAERGNHASPHGDSIDGKPVVGSKARLRVTMKPSGAAWASVRDELQYVLAELGKGMMPDGSRAVSEKNMLERRVPQVAYGANDSYGMGLVISRMSGVTVLQHGGAVGGFRSNFFALPEHGVGAVILTNSGPGQSIEEPLLRRLLEVLFDGAPEAEEDLAANMQRERAARAAERARLNVPADAGVMNGLGKRYKHPSLGLIELKRRGAATVLDVGEWSTEVATRKNDDGTVSLIGIEPDLDEELVIGQREGKRVLIYREMQKEYVFVESR